MPETKKRPELGDRAFEVEWCIEIPNYPDSEDRDIDNAKYRRRIVATKDDALSLAKEVYPQDQFGAVTVTPVEFIDPYEENIPKTFRWDYCGDSLHYSGDEDFE